MLYFSDRSTRKDEKPKRPLKVVFPPNESVHYFFITERIERWATSSQKCRSSRGKQNCSQIQWSWINQCLLLFFSLQKPESVTGIVLSVCQSRGTQQKCATIQINGQWSCIKANFLWDSWLIYETFYGIFFFRVQSAFTTQHCCLSETELYCICHLTEIRVPNTVYTGTCILSFCAHAQVRAVHAVPLMVGRLTDAQAEPNLQSKYQGW